MRIQPTPNPISFKGPLYPLTFKGHPFPRGSYKQDTFVYPGYPGVTTTVQTTEETGNILKYFA